MIPLIVIRPEPGCAASVGAAQAMGLAALGFPLFKVMALPWEAPAPENFDALLAGSANAFRHGGDALARFCALPVHAVGTATAAAARAAGFSVAATGRGGLQAVVSAMPAGTRLLRLAGAERVALVLPASISVTERVVYASNALPMPTEMAGLLARPVVTMLHSAAAAHHFAAECQRLKVDRARIALASIGPRVTAAAGLGWQAIATAAAPAESLLLAVAYDLCQDRGRNQVRSEG